MYQFRICFRNHSGYHNFNIFNHMHRCADLCNLWRSVCHIKTLEDTKAVIGDRNSKDRHYNGHMKKGIKTINEWQNTTQKRKEQNERIFTTIQKIHSQYYPTLSCVVNTNTSDIQVQPWCIFHKQTTYPQQIYDRYSAIYKIGLFSFYWSACTKQMYSHVYVC